MKKQLRDKEDKLSGSKIYQKGTPKVENKQNGGEEKLLKIFSLLKYSQNTKLKRYRKYSPLFSQSILLPGVNWYHNFLMYMLREISYIKIIT